MGIHDERIKEETKERREKVTKKSHGTKSILGACKRHKKNGRLALRQTFFTFEAALQRIIEE